MTLRQVTLHGRTRFRLNVQRGWVRRRLYFALEDDALAFIAAARGNLKTTSRRPAHRRRFPAR